MGVSAGTPGVARAAGLNFPLHVASVPLRKLVDGIEECTEDTSIGDAEAGIAIYYDEEACNQEDPAVGCNGESP